MDWRLATGNSIWGSWVKLSLENSPKEKMSAEENRRFAVITKNESLVCGRMLKCITAGAIWRLVLVSGESQTEKPEFFPG